MSSCKNVILWMVRQGEHDAALSYLSHLAKESKMSETMTERLTEYTLDIKTWRCGPTEGGTPFSMGKGNTRLKNKEGYMCCLGQFATQAGVTLTDPSFLNPIYLFTDYGQYDPNFVNEDGTHTRLTAECIQINDSHNLTVRERVEMLTDLLMKHGITLNVVNEHLIPDPSENEEEDE